jgi:hypothetical protein
MNPLAGFQRIAVATVFFCGLTGCIGAPSADGGESAAAARADGVGESVTTLWIHGRNSSGSTTPGDYRDFSYWGSSDTPAGSDAKAVNWDGRSRISESNDMIRRALDCFCTGDHFCAIAAHSAGDPQIGYALDFYGGAERDITDGSPDSSGTCAPTGRTQTGWNIKWVDVAGGAAGGTELADVGSWAVSDPLTADLRTGAARSLYDHNNTQGVPFYMFAGAKGTAYSAVLPGQDDEVIAYHSSGALSGTGAFCNPGDWFCDGELEYGSDASKKKKGDVAKWANHSVALRDDGEKYDHYARGSWGGIIAPMREDVVASAY